MQRALAFAGLVLVAMNGVAYADSPGGWSQSNDLATKAQGRVKESGQEVQVQQAKPVSEYSTQNRRNTQLFLPNPNEGANQ